MKKNWKKYVSLLLAVMVFSACTPNGQSNPSNATKTEENKQADEKGKSEKSGEASNKNKGVKAPDFTLQDWDGNEVSLSALEGKKVYLKFWASWCHYCVEGMPDLAELVEEDNDFEIYTIVAPEYSGELSLEKFKSWYEEKGFSKKIKVLFDEKGATMRAYGISGYPTNAFIGTDGVLARKVPGIANNEKVKETMEKVQ